MECVCGGGEKGQLGRCELEQSTSVGCLTQKKEKNKREKKKRNLDLRRDIVRGKVAGENEVIDFGARGGGV